MCSCKDWLRRSQKLGTEEAVCSAALHKIEESFQRPLRPEYSSSFLQFALSVAHITLLVDGYVLFLLGRGNPKQAYFDTKRRNFRNSQIEELLAVVISLEP